MFQWLLPLCDLALIAILTYALFLPRHRRRDLILSYLAVNIGVLAVARALSETSVNAGLGLGLFGVLALIRLRSAELDQHEIAYYFSSLALGLIGGLGADMGWAAVALMAGLVAVMAIADSGLILRSYRVETVVVDQAIAGEEELRARLEVILGAKVLGVTVRKLDLVNDLTVVDARFAVGAPRLAAAGTAAP
jgi:hypothetical protein